MAFDHAFDVVVDEEVDLVVPATWIHDVRDEVRDEQLGAGAGWGGGKERNLDFKKPHTA